MVTTYQIRNVLRIYGNQLKKRAIISHESDSNTRQAADTITISGEARRKTDILNHISNKIVTQIANGSFQAE